MNKKDLIEMDKSLSFRENASDLPTCGEMLSLTKNMGDAI